MLSSPPDALLKEEGTTAASLVFLPQAYCFFPHPPRVSTWSFVHLALSKWDHPILSSLPCWASCGLGKRLVTTYGVTQRPILPLCSIRAHFYVSSCSYPQGWCCFMVTLLRCQNRHLAVGFFMQWSDWMLLYLLSFHHLWHGQSFSEYWGIGKAVCDYMYMPQQGYHLLSVLLIKLVKLVSL